MRYGQITFSVMVVLLLVSGAQADIFRWVDQKGVVHFSNYSPPDQAEVFIKERTGGTRTAGESDEIVRDAVLAARQEMERVLQEDRLREVNAKLDELLRRSESVEARLAAAQASAAQARDLAQQAMAERQYDDGPDTIYVMQPGYLPGYPSYYYGDFGLGYGIRRFDGSSFGGRYIRPFGLHKFGKHSHFRSRFDGFTHHRSYRTFPSMSGVRTKFHSTPRGFHGVRDR